jgi:hypothetical protein
MLNNLMRGGASKTIEKSMNSPGLFFILVVVFFLNVILVQWSYNKVFPVLSNNMGYSGEFKPLTFGESILVVILFNSLF